MGVLIFLELGLALLLVLIVWGWLRWHRPQDDPGTKKNMHR